MLLSCPRCSKQHIDKDERARDDYAVGSVSGEDWTTRPHVRHLCHHCGNVWTPYNTKGVEFDVPTVGIDRFVRVRLESPFADAIDSGPKIIYARLAMRDCLLRGEAPFASHLLYTQPSVLDDTSPVERELGIQAGLTFDRDVERVVVYTDLGITEGMRTGMQHARDHNVPIVERTLEGWSES